jgi:hypothetical protein
MKTNMVLGIDIGNVIAHKVNDQHVEVPGAFETINRLRPRFDNVFVVSRVSEPGEKRSRAWLEKNNFYWKTGIPYDNVHYCRKRHEKGPICAVLKITHFIDDRPEVMFHLDPAINKIFFNPNLKDLEEWKSKISQPKWYLRNWIDVERVLDGLL